MSEPERLNRSGGLGGSLLASAKADRPPPGASRRVLAGAAVAAAIAGKASTSAAATASTFGTAARWAAWKWAAVGLAGAGSAIVVRAAVSPWVHPRSSGVVQQATTAAGTMPPRTATSGGPKSESAEAASASPFPLPLTAPPAEHVEPARALPAVPSPASTLTFSPSAVPSAPAPPPSRLAAQIAAIDDAKRSLAAGDFAGALRKVDAYDAAFPHATLAAEATALRIEALFGSGQRREARNALARFRVDHPLSPLEANLARVVGD